MGILQLPTPIAANTGNIPNIKTMCTTDNLAAITAAAYLNSVNLEGYPVSSTDEIHVTYSFNTVTQSGTLGIFTVSITNGVITLVEQNSSHGVTATLPTTVGNIATYSNTAGDITQNATTAINGGNIQAGANGVQGGFTAYPSVANTSHLNVYASGNTSNITYNLTTTSLTTGTGPVNTYVLPPLNNGSANILVSDSTQQMASTGAILLAKNNGTCSANAVTTAGQSGQITTESLTTAQYSSYTFTWTSLNLAANSTLLLTIGGGSNTRQGVVASVNSAGSGVFGISVTNLDSAALNGTVIINYAIF